jgi:hypothetical protein
MEIKRQLELLQKEAEEYCRKVNLDDAIRTVCKSDASRGDDTNRSIKIPLPNGKTLELKATWDAGCNGAYARYSDNSCRLSYFHLYECTEYGQYLSAFQKGEWVEVVLKLAGQEALVQQAQAQAGEMKRLQDELRKWMPSD